MAVRIYKSTDASAPVLTGQVGSLVALLDAILVNGYTGKTAAGWAKAFTATNKASYRMATTGNTGFYLDVDDSGPNGSGAREARMRGYEAMTAVATGTNGFPTSAQSSFGVICRKSTTSDSVARPWYCVADGSVFYLWVDTGDLAGPTASFGFAFGDFFSYLTSDAYRCMIIGRSTENSSNDYNDQLGMLYIGPAPQKDFFSAHYLARSHTTLGGSQGFTKFSSVLCGTAGGSGSRCPIGGPSASLAYPNGPDQALVMSPLFVGQGGAIRGYLKGLWAPAHFAPLGHGDTFNGTGGMAGKSFLALNTCSDQNNAPTSGTRGQMIVETSDTWS